MTEAARGVFMAMSKKDLTRARGNIRARIEELEVKVRLDPLRRHPEMHEELAKLKKEIASN
jgi:hypothetical protein